jgi:hypothetical protein
MPLGRLQRGSQHQRNREANVRMASLLLFGHRKADGKLPSVVLVFHLTRGMSVRTGSGSDA